MKKDESQKKDLPVFNLKVFSKKGRWSDFYIQDLKEHIAEHEFVAKPHKHDFYLILFVTQGSGTHVIDFTSYPVKHGSLFLMTPGQVHSWTLSKNSAGYIVFFTQEFYQLQLNQNSLLEFPFYHSLGASPVVVPKKTDVVKFTMEKMLEEYNQSDSPGARIIRAYLDLLLLEAAKNYDGTSKNTIHANTFKLRKLEQLIDENFKTLKQASDYADLMNLAPAYLNSICKHSLGKTLSELIQQRILLEAKRMFAYSDWNVNEIASALNFNDPSYFVRWFKKQNGNTPEEFRKMI